LILIDPIDGTENFASGLPIWGVGLAYFVKNKIQATCVLFPEMKLFHASSAVIMDKSCVYSQLRRGSSKRSNCVHPANFEKNSLFEDSFTYQNRILGCSLMNISLACYDAWIFKSSGPGLKTWDFLPAILPALENGKLVYVNKNAYSGEYLSEEKRYHLQIKSK
jgi:myo-inositol-1(or 4)-monophosphatase